MVRGPLGWMSANPLRTAGLAGALAALGYVVAGAGAVTGGSETTAAGVSGAAVVAFALAHPAYPVVAALGVGAFLLLD